MWKNKGHRPGQWGLIMLRSTAEEGRLHLTADLRATEGMPRTPMQRQVKASRFLTDRKQFPPVDDVVAILDRIASRSFVA
ncbi:MAG: hypothetical protein B7Z04_01885 [Rhodobacterales bacterium 32-66-9]|nr:MAG: hypothetical protein B7Z04_01885 [Rhodobacterales bacterium 32-66-9]